MDTYKNEFKTTTTKTVISYFLHGFSQSQKNKLLRSFALTSVTPLKWCSLQNSKSKRESPSSHLRGQWDTVRILFSFLELHPWEQAADTSYPFHSSLRRKEGMILPLRGSSCQLFQSVICNLPPTQQSCLGSGSAWLERLEQLEGQPCCSSMPQQAQLLGWAPEARELLCRNTASSFH